MEGSGGAVLQRVHAVLTGRLLKVSRCGGWGRQGKGGLAHPALSIVLPLILRVLSPSSVHSMKLA